MNKRHRKTNHLRRPLICSPCEFLKKPMQALHTIGDFCFWVSFLSSLFIQQFCNAVPSWVPSRVSCFFSFQFLIFSLSLFFLQILHNDIANLRQDCEQDTPPPFKSSVPQMLDKISFILSIIPLSLLVHVSWNAWCVQKLPTSFSSSTQVKCPGLVVPFHFAALLVRLCSAVWIVQSWYCPRCSVLVLYSSSVLVVWCYSVVEMKSALSPLSAPQGGPFGLQTCPG